MAVDEPANGRPSRCREWKPTQLKSRTLLALMAIEFAMISTITILLGLSVTHTGFAQVRENSSVSPSSNFWHQGLLWTSLPSLLMSLYAAFRISLGASLARRQPFIELNARHGTPAKLSVTLDYAAMLVPVALYKAVRNRHPAVITGLSFSIVAQFGLVPLVARLFDTGSVPQSTPALMQVTSNSVDLRYNATTNLQPIFDTVAAVQIYRGAPPPWTDMHYAFPSFDLADADSLPPTSRNLSLDVPARSAELDCRQIRNYTHVTDDHHATFHAWDRGCQISTFLSPSASPAFYLATSATINCATFADPSRFVLAAGQYDAESASLFRGFTLISCIPRYFTTPGRLEVSGDGSNDALTLNFTPAVSTPPAPDKFLPWHGYESALHQVGYYDPASNLSTTGLGSLILDAARQTDPDALFHASSLIDTAERLFSSIFAVLGVLVLAAPATPPAIAPGLMTEAHTRLFIVPAVASIMLGILIFAMVSTFYIHVHAKNTFTVLCEEPASLAAYANLLFESDMMQLVRQMRQRHDYDGRFVEYFKRNYDGDLTTVLMDDPASESSRLTFSDLTHRAFV